MVIRLCPSSARAARTQSRRGLEHHLILRAVVDARSRNAQLCGNGRGSPAELCWPFSRHDSPYQISSHAFATEPNYFQASMLELNRITQSPEVVAGNPCRATYACDRWDHSGPYPGRSVPAGNLSGSPYLQAEGIAAFSPRRPTNTARISGFGNVGVEVSAGGEKRHVPVDTKDYSPSAAVV